MRIVVTGGAGFIGSHLVEALVEGGHEVAVFDNLSSGRRSNVDPAATFYEVDLTDEPALRAAMTGFRPEVIYHLAAQTSVPISLTAPARDAEANIVGGVNLLNQAVAHGVRKVVNSSSGGAIYGNPIDVHCDESETIKPISPYGVAKYCMEQYLAMYHRTFGLAYTALRYANVYGPRQVSATDGAVIATFAQRMLSGQPVTIDGTGEQARDFVHVSDVVDANILAMKRGANTAYNIGSGVLTTINEVFDLLAQCTDYQAAPAYGPSRMADVYAIALRCERAKTELGWAPRVELPSGLGGVVHHLQAERTAPVARSCQRQSGTNPTPPADLTRRAACGCVSGRELCGEAERRWQAVLDCYAVGDPKGAEVARAAFVAHYVPAAGVPTHRQADLAGQALEAHHAN